MESGSGSSSTSRWMAFGENNNLCRPMIMMPPNMVSSHPNGNNTPFLPTPVSTHRQDLNLHGDGGGSSMLLEENHNSGNNNTSNGYCLMETSNNTDSSDGIKAKIMAHPHYHRLLAAFVNCQKVGAPPDVVARLEEAVASSAAMGPHRTSCVGEDPALDQFMEAYCEMLAKYEQELSKPFKEATLFFSRIECQFKALTRSNSDSVACGEAVERNASSEDQVDVNNIPLDPQAEDHDLKVQLMRKYSGYLGNLKQEFMKSKKKGKLPKQARQQLLDWWNRHYKWPYPSESQKLALAESTGLEQKQINNWFINQRKRHWKPSEDMQFVVLEPRYYMDNVFGNPFAMDISQGFL